MDTTKFGGTGHGMPAPVSPDVEKRQAEQEEAKRKQQMKNFAKNSLPTKGTETIQVHETKHIPLVIVEVTKTDDHDNEEKMFKVGAMGHFMSEKSFKTLESAEKYVNARPWDLITNLICLLIQNANEYEKSQSNN